MLKTDANKVTLGKGVAEEVNIDFLNNSNHKVRSNPTSGKLEFSVNGGATWNAFGAEGAGSEDLTKIDHSSPAFFKAAADEIFIKAGTKIVVNGTPVGFPIDTAVTMPGALTPGTDYAIYICEDGSLLATDNFSAPAGYDEISSIKVGGFHYGLVDEVETLATGSFATAGPGMHWTQADVDKLRGVNEFSLWDLKFRPACEDPRGMALIAGRFWVDIYFTNTNHEVNGTSRSGTDVASGTVLPKVPEIMGGDGVLNYGNGNWWTFNEIARAHGKRMLTESEFGIAAFGTTEGQSLGGASETIPLTKREPGYTSKFGLEQVSGHVLTWGEDSSFRYDGTQSGSWKDVADGRGNVYTYGTYGLVRVRLGGHRTNGADSGSRSSNWGSYPWHSNWGSCLRAACDHLSLR